MAHEWATHLANGNSSRNTELPYGFNPTLGSSLYTPITSPPLQPGSSSLLPMNTSHHGVTGGPRRSSNDARASPTPGNQTRLTPTESDNHSPGITSVPLPRRPVPLLQHGQVRKDNSSPIVSPISMALSPAASPGVVLSPPASVSVMSSISSVTASSQSNSSRDTEGKNITPDSSSAVSSVSQVSTATPPINTATPKMGESAPSSYYPNSSPSAKSSPTTATIPSIGPQALPVAQEITSFYHRRESVSSSMSGSSLTTDVTAGDGEDGGGGGGIDDDDHDDDDSDTSSVDSLRHYRRRSQNRRSSLGGLYIGPGNGGRRKQRRSTLTGLVEADAPHEILRSNLHPVRDGRGNEKNSMSPSRSSNSSGGGHRTDVAKPNGASSRNTPLLPPAIITLSSTNAESIAALSSTTQHSPANPIISPVTATGLKGSPPRYGSIQPSNATDSHRPNAIQSISAFYTSVSNRQSQQEASLDHHHPSYVTRRHSMARSSLSSVTSITSDGMGRHGLPALPRANVASDTQSQGRGSISSVSSGMSTLTQSTDVSSTGDSTLASRSSPSTSTDILKESGNSRSTITTTTTTTPAIPRMFRQVDVVDATNNNPPHNTSLVKVTNTADTLSSKEHVPSKRTGGQSHSPHPTDSPSESTINTANQETINHAPLSPLQAPLLVLELPQHRRSRSLPGGHHKRAGSLLHGQLAKLSDTMMRPITEGTGISGSGQAESGGRSDRSTGIEERLNEDGDLGEGKYDRRRRESMESEMSGSTTTSGSILASTGSTSTVDKESTLDKNKVKNREGEDPKGRKTSAKRRLSLDLHNPASGSKRRNSASDDSGGGGSSGTTSHSPTPQQRRRGSSTIIHKGTSTKSRNNRRPSASNPPPDQSTLVSTTRPTLQMSAAADTPGRSSLTVPPLPLQTTTLLTTANTTPVKLSAADPLASTKGQGIRGNITPPKTSSLIQEGAPLGAPHNAGRAPGVGTSLLTDSETRKIRGPHGHGSYKGENSSESLSPSLLRGADEDRPSIQSSANEHTSERVAADEQWKALMKHAYINEGPTHEEILNMAVARQKGSQTKATVSSHPGPASTAHQQTTSTSATSAQSSDRCDNSSSSSSNSGSGDTKDKTPFMTLQQFLQFGSVSESDSDDSDLANDSVLLATAVATQHRDDFSEQPPQASKAKQVTSTQQTRSKSPNRERTGEMAERAKGPAHHSQASRSIRQPTKRGNVSPTRLPLPNDETRQNSGSTWTRQSPSPSTSRTHAPSYEPGSDATQSATTVTTELSLDDPQTLAVRMLLMQGKRLRKRQRRAVQQMTEELTQVEEEMKNREERVKEVLDEQARHLRMQGIDVPFGRQTIKDAIILSGDKQLLSDQVSGSNTKGKKYNNQGKNTSQSNDMHGVDNVGAEPDDAHGQVQDKVESVRKWVASMDEDAQKRGAAIAVAKAIEKQEHAVSVLSGLEQWASKR